MAIHSYALSSFSAFMKYLSKWPRIVTILVTILLNAVIIVPIGICTAINGIGVNSVVGWLATVAIIVVLVSGISLLSLYYTYLEYREGLRLRKLDTEMSSAL